MKLINIILLFSLTFFVACGYSAKDNTVVGQAKKLMHKTPIVCDERFDGDLSLGVMNNGVGSMSTQDQWFTMGNPEAKKAYEQAVDKGSIVKLTYDVKRWTWCWEDHIVNKVEVIK
jgi:hypothetical protein